MASTVSSGSNGSANAKQQPEFLASHTYLCVGPPGAKAAVEWYKDVFGFRVVEIVEDPKKTTEGGLPLVHHAHLKSGAVELMLADDVEEFRVKGGKLPPSALGGTTFTFMLVLEEPDPVFRHALQKGASETMPLKQQDWGCRVGKLIDPWGFEWALMTPMETGGAE